MRVEYLMKGADVSESQVSKAEAAQERSEQTRSFVRTVVGCQLKWDRKLIETLS